MKKRIITCFAISLIINLILCFLVSLFVKDKDVIFFSGLFCFLSLFICIESIYFIIYEKKNIADRIYNIILSITLTFFITLFTIGTFSKVTFLFLPFVILTITITILLYLKNEITNILKKFFE